MSISPLVSRALERYGLVETQIKPLGGFDNLNYRIDADSAAYALHLHTSPHHSLESLQAEMLWLSALSLDTPVAVPEPVPDTSGAFVTVLPDGAKAIPCTLTRWVEGKVPPTVDAMRNEQLAQVGAIMAHLHRHAQRYIPGARDAYRTYDSAHYREQFKRVVGVLEGSVSREGLEDLKGNAEAVFTKLADLGRDREAFGLIHGDFHSGNYLLDGDAVRLIDFNRCGMGFYLFDLALALMELEPPRRAPILEGYRSVAPLPVGYAELEPLFLALAYLDNLGTLAVNKDEWAFIRGDAELLIDAFGKAAVSV